MSDADTLSPRHFRVFISSPGDVADERGLARKVCKDLPSIPLIRGRITVEVISWDDPSSRTPMLANMIPQEAIDSGLPKPSDCDIVIVIFWGRMGTPLPDTYKKADGSRYLSGTEWEYEDALKSGKPEILVYKRTEKVLVEFEDPEFKVKKKQHQNVKAFFSRFHDDDGPIQHGCNEYKEPNDFQKLLENDIQVLVRRLLETAPPTWVPDRPSSKAHDTFLWEGSPYPGLRALTAKDAPIFFGRGPEVDDLLEEIRQPELRFLAVVGASGAGKSSLVGAGLLPRLADNAIEGSRDWLTVTFTPGQVGGNPFGSLALQLASILSTSQMPEIQRLAQRLDSSLFRKDDEIEDWVGFLSRLRRENNEEQSSPSKRLYSLLRSDIRMLVDAPPSDLTYQKENKSKIIKALNGILEYRDFYEERDFLAVDLPEEVKILIQKRERLSLDDVPRLNRLLLEAAYSKEMSRSQRFVEDPDELITICRGALIDRPQWAKMLLFIDQFEELFTLVGAKYRTPFISMIHHMSADKRMRVVITLRTDFSAMAADLPKLSGLLKRGTYLLGPPKSAELREIITRPANLKGLDLGEDFVDQIVKDVETKPGALPLMAFTLHELYQYRKGQLTLDSYKKQGGIRGVIAKRAEATLNGLDVKAQNCLSSVFSNLADVNYSGVVRRKRIVQPTIVGSPAAKRLVDALIEARLLVTSLGEDRQPLVEVAHEALFEQWPRFKAFLYESQKFRLWQQSLRDAIAQWEDSERIADMLWLGEPLSDAEIWMKRWPDKLSSPERDFIRKSRQQQLEDKQRYMAEALSQAEDVDFSVPSLLKMRDPARFLAVPRNFRDKVERASLERDIDKLELLAKEVDGLDWGIDALRQIGRELFYQKAYEKATETLERIRARDPEDLEVNTLLGTIYQRLGDLGKSDIAIERALQNANLSSWDRAEIRSLMARNAKVLWEEDWREIEELDDVQKEALDSPHLEVSFELYRQGFVEDRNHFYSGLNTLAMVTVMTELAAAQYKIWEDRFDSEEEASIKLQKLKELRSDLAAGIKLAIESNRTALAREDKTDIWVEIGDADLTYLTSTRSNRVGRAYKKALATAPDFARDAERNQLLLYRRLGILKENTQTALDNIPVMAHKKAMFHDRPPTWQRISKGPETPILKHISSDLRAG